MLRSIDNSEIKCEGANLFLSDGEIAGEEVSRSHLHIAPRFKGDGHRMEFSGTDADEKERSKLEVIAEFICNQ